MRTAKATKKETTMVGARFNNLDYRRLLMGLKSSKRWRKKNDSINPAAFAWEAIKEKMDKEGF